MIEGVPDNPFISMLGAELIEWRPGHCLWQLSVKPEFRNTWDGMHGGLVGTLLDVACAYSGLYPIEGQGAVKASTLSLNIQYIAPVKGDLVTARGCLVGGGNKIYFAEAELFEGRKLVAKASGNFRRSGVKQ